MTQKNVYKIGKIHQLFDLNHDTLNFVCNFRIMGDSADRKFEYLVVSQEQLDSDQKLPEFNKAQGAGVGRIVADKGQFQNFFLALKSDEDISVQVETHFEKLADDIHLKPKEESKQGAAQPESNKQQESGGPVPPGDFEAAPAYAGPRDGKVFKMGPNGLGYYKDIQQQAPPAPSGQPSTETAKQAELDSRYMEYIKQLQQQQQHQQQQQRQMLQHQNAHNEYMQKQLQQLPPAPAQPAPPPPPTDSFMTRMLKNKVMWVFLGITLLVLLYFTCIHKSAATKNKDATSIEGASKKNDGKGDSGKGDNGGGKAEPVIMNAKKGSLNIDKLNSLK